MLAIAEPKRGCTDLLDDGSYQWSSVCPGMLKLCYFRRVQSPKCIGLVAAAVRSLPQAHEILYDESTYNW